MVDKPLIPRPLGLSTDASPLGLIRWSASKKPKTRSWKRVRMSKRYSPNVAKHVARWWKSMAQLPSSVAICKGPWEAEPIHESWRHLLSRWCNCCTILPDFFCLKKMVEPSSLGHFLIKQAASQTVTGYFGAGKLWSNSLRIFLKNQLLSLKLTDITPENGGLEYHSFGIAYFHGRTVC